MTSVRVNTPKAKFNIHVDGVPTLDDGDVRKVCDDVLNKLPSATIFANMKVGVGGSLYLTDIRIEMPGQAEKK